MPTPEKGESKKDFLKRCISYVMRYNEASSPQQAVAMCYSMWNRSRPTGSPERPLKVKVKRVEDQRLPDGNQREEKNDS